MYLYPKDSMWDLSAFAAASSRKEQQYKSSKAIQTYSG